MPIVPNQALINILTAFRSPSPGYIPIPQPYYDVFYNAIVASPALLNRLNNDAESGALTKIIYQPSGGGAGYTGGTFIVGGNFIQPPGQAIISQNDLIFVLGHEEMHVTNSIGVATMDAAWNAATAASVAAFVATPANPIQDLTATVRTRLDVHLRDEAAANIQGANDVLSRAVTDNGGNMLSRTAMRDLVRNSGYLSRFRTYANH